MTRSPTHAASDSLTAMERQLLASVEQLSEQYRKDVGKLTEGLKTLSAHYEQSIAAQEKRRADETSQLTTSLNNWARKQDETRRSELTGLQASLKQAVDLQNERISALESSLSTLNASLATLLKSVAR
jgi:hypothetical protein